MSTLGICSAHIVRAGLNNNLNFETFSLYEEGKKTYQKVILINPLHVSYRFEREQKPIIYFNGDSITDLSALIVRGTGEYSQSISMLVQSLDFCGCNIFDPITRFRGEPSSKLFTTLDRYKEGVGTSSYIAFSFEGISSMIRVLASEKKFPLLIKPIRGSGGKGVVVIQDEIEAVNYAQEFFHSKQTDVPLLIQAYINFTEEYRIIVIDGVAIGSVQKLAKPGSVAANAEQGGEFIAAHVPEVANFVEEHVSKEGILGVDVAKDENGNLHIIEANRAPLWRTFQQATGINVAREIIDRSLTRIKVEH